MLETSFDACNSNKNFISDPFAAQRLGRRMMHPLKKLFSHLQFEFHILIHYPEILKRMGPLIRFWCMRYESRHRILKTISNAISGNKNVFKTIVIKELLRLCNYRHTVQISENTSSGPKDLDLCDLNVLSSMKKEILSNAEFHTKVVVSENKFKIGTIILVNIENMSKTLKYFSILKNVFKLHNFY